VTAPATQSFVEPRPDDRDGDGLATLEQLWAGRSSTRGFLREPIPREDLTRMFSAAQRAPSWCNIQPWRVMLTEPPLTGELGEAMQAAARSGQPGAEVPWPGEYPSPYKERRVACGSALYQAMGVSRSDTAARYDAFMRNYGFFGAPHVAIVSCDGRLGPYPYVDVGVWLGYVLTAAAALGIDSCALASVGSYPGPLRQRLPIPQTDVILFGIALGRADDAVPANRCRTEREPVTSNVTFVR
jgi:nitroreductase